jgi:hypothetical protein
VRISHALSLPHVNVEELNLAHNQIQDEGAVAIAQMLLKNTKLKL